MLKLRDFVHLPQVDALFEQLVADAPGLILLAGIEARPSVLPSSDVFKPSGLSGLFNILMQEILLSRPLSKALVIAKEKSLAKVPRQLSRRVHFVRVEPPFSYAGQIELAILDRPDLLVIDHLTEEALPAVMRAAESGLRVLTQLDTVLRGPSVARQLIEMGAAQEQLQHLRWIITSHRVSVLCERCKQVVEDTESVFKRVRTRYPHLSAAIDSLHPVEETKNGHAVRPVRQAGFVRAGGCDHCRGRGFSGDISAFDIFRNDPNQGSLFAQASLLPLEEYILRLAWEGQFDVMDLLELESGHLRQVYQLLTTSERALVDSNATLNRKLIELEASNRVLVQRTEVLMSLQDLGQALITSVELNDLAARVCRRAGELCGADRVVLYLRRILEDRSEVAEILAERGWGLDWTGVRLEARQVFGVPSAAQTAMRASRYTQIPPGFRSETTAGPDSANPIKTGLQVPLFAQEQLVGIMIVQSTQKDFFSQGEMALLQTFANQAALAFQRAGLIEELREKIAQLEAAQAELVTKERMARELELARQVQQSMLPHSFPAVTGYALSARNEPARQVGGDFYDVILLDADHFGIVVADVADKGLPAALYMALTRSLLLAEARRTLSPRETLINVNRLLLELGELNGFVSIFYGVVESSTRQVTYARAGHERPLLLRNGEVSSLGGEGAVLGILDDVDFNLTEEQAGLAPGDRLILYTDGLTDVLDSAGNFSGLDQLKRLLRLHAREDAEGVCEALFNALATYRGAAEQFDDMTVLVLEVSS